MPMPDSTVPAFGRMESYSAMLYRIQRLRMWHEYPMPSVDRRGPPAYMHGSTTEATAISRCDLAPLLLQDAGGGGLPCDTAVAGSAAESRGRLLAAAADPDARPWRGVARRARGCRHRQHARREVRRALVRELIKAAAGQLHTPCMFASHMAPC